jgi:hypothetical protein
MKFVWLENVIATYFTQKVIGKLLAFFLPAHTGIFVFSANPQYDALFSALYRDLCVIIIDFYDRIIWGRSSQETKRSLSSYNAIFQ